jgi:ATP-dependent RNA helicase DHX8/PRP22
LLSCRKKPLKLLLTSATLDACKFSAYFDGCPVLTVPGRQYQVQIVHAQENHERDYVVAAVDTALDIHIHQPLGDILVFLTGQAEIEKVLYSASLCACCMWSHQKVQAL